MLLACSACAPRSHRSPPAPPANQGVCAQLAHIFFLIALDKDRGRSQESQVRMVKEGVNNPFSGAPDETLDHLLRVVDKVYASKADADEIRDAVLASCEVDEQGHAVVSPPLTPL